MGNIPLFVVMFLTLAIQIAVPLARIINGLMLRSWRLLMEAYPGRELLWDTACRFTTAMIIGGRFPLRLNNMLQLFATPDCLCLSTAFGGAPEVLIRWSDVVRFTDRSDLLFTRVELTLQKTGLSLRFFGRGGRFVKRWWRLRSYGTG